MKVQCEVFKYDPDSDTEGRFTTYTLDIEPSDTVLDALKLIYRDHDSDIAFRFACGIVRCGECAMLVNGVPCLSCDKSVEPVLKLEPLPNLPIIKDLVIDRRGVLEKVHELLPQSIGIEGKKLGFGSRDPEAVKAIEQSVRLSKCLECLICQSSCPVYEGNGSSFVGPLGLLWLAQMCTNPLSQPVSSKDVRRIKEPCLHCGICSENCPAEEDQISLALEVLEEQ